MSIRAIKRAIVIAVCIAISWGCTPAVTIVKPTIDELGCGPVPLAGVVTQQNKFTLAKLLIGGKSVEGLNIENTPTFHVLMSKASGDLAAVQYLKCVALKSGEVEIDNQELQECIENKRLFFTLNPTPDQFAQYVRDNRCGSAQVQSDATVRTANELRQEFARATALRTQPLNEDDFRRVHELITTLSQIDPRNGHAFYYSGQMKRWLGRKTEAQQDFYKYLENEPQQPKVAREGDISVETCYRSAAGYCRQRSGWICHLLANDFYQKGLVEGGTDQARYHFNLAVQYAQKTLGFFPGGFEQFTPTQMVERDSKARIAILDAAVGANRLR